MAPQHFLDVFWASIGLLFLLTVANTVLALMIDAWRRRHPSYQNPTLSAWRQRANRVARPLLLVLAMVSSPSGYLLLLRSERFFRSPRKLRAQTKLLGIAAAVSRLVLTTICLVRSGDGIDWSAVASTAASALTGIVSVVQVRRVPPRRAPGCVRPSPRRLTRSARPRSSKAAAGTQILRESKWKQDKWKQLPDASGALGTEAHEMTSPAARDDERAGPPYDLEDDSEGAPTGRTSSTALASLATPPT